MNQNLMDFDIGADKLLLAVLLASVFLFCVLAHALHPDTESVGRKEYKL